MLRKLKIKYKEIRNKLEKIDNCLLDLKFNQRKIVLENNLLNSFESGISEKKYCDHEIIVSLTSYGKRLEEVWLPIESIMQQTLKPNKIILWVDKEVEINSLPQSLKLQQERGLIIKKYNPHIRSYKKLIPTLKEYPEAIIITIDDDLIYDCNLLDKMIRSYKIYPNAIHACRLHKITYYEDGTLKKYNDWQWCVPNGSEDDNLFFTGVGGVLYPPNSLDTEVLNEKVFQELAPTADDVWFYAMARKKGTKIIKVNTQNPYGEDYLINESVQDIALKHQNTLSNNLNDIQINNIYSKYNL